MIHEKIIYFLREALRNFRTNPVATGISTAIIALSLLVFGLFLLFFFNFRTVFDHLGRKVRIDAYLMDEIAPDAVATAEMKIRSVRGVEKIEFVSADRALAEFEAMLGGQEELLRELETNPLPASFKIYPSNEFRAPSRVASLAGEIGKIEGVAEVRWGADWVEKFGALIRAIQIVGLVTGGILLLSSLLIISNTISLTIYARQEEIEIMRLVGAEESFVRIPFIIEGMFQGVTASWIALFMLWTIYISALSKIDAPLALIGSATIKFLPLSVSLSMAAGGALLGMLGAGFAMSRKGKKETRHF